MAKERVDYTTTAATITVLFWQKSDGFVWTGAAFEDPTGKTDANMATYDIAAVEQQSSDSTCLGYWVTIPAGITVPCLMTAYLGGYTASDDAIWSGDYLPEVDAIAISGDKTAADNAEAFFDGTGYAGTGNVIPTVTTLTGHTVQTADHTASIATAQSDLDTITGSDGATLATTQGNYAPAKAGDEMAVSSLTSAAITDVWSTDTLTEAYAADNAAATPAQLMYMLWSALSEFSIASTTITAKKLDGSTTAMTFTLDDGSSPTSRTRAT